MFLGGIITSIFGLLSGISKLEKTPKWITWGSFIAGLIVIGAGFISAYQDQIKSELAEKQAREIVEISKSNANLALINSELNKKISNTITGGDSYCSFIIIPKYESNAFELLLHHKGEYPVYDVEIQIHDITKKIEYSRTSNSSLTEYFKIQNKFRQLIKAGNIAPNTGYQLGSLPLPDDADKQTYHIQIFSRNGQILQIMQFRRIQGKWKWAEKTVFNDEVVDKHFPSDFPRDEDSKSIWGE